MALTLKPLGSSVWVVSPEDQVQLEFARIAESKETVTAEVSITGPLGEAGWGRVNLLSTTGRATLIKAATETSPAAEWKQIIDPACKMVVKHLRRGNQPIPLVPKEPLPDWVSDKWLVPGLIAKRQINVLYGPGDSGKSWLAMAILVSGIQEHPLSQRWHVNSVKRAMYLDWESDEADGQERLWRLTAGREVFDPARLVYLPMRRPIDEQVEALSNYVAREGVDVVVTDSLGAASGLEPESNEAALRTMGALRQIEATHLVIGHIPKSSMDQDGPRHLFGGIYNTNMSRSIIEVRRRDDEDRMVLDLYHRKCNIAMKGKPSALMFSMSEDGTCWITGAEADPSGMSLSSQILQALKIGRQTGTSIAELIGADPDSVRRTLGRLANRDMVVRLTATLGGKGKESEWGLANGNRDTNRD